jgi:hypothetical protein
METEQLHIGNKKIAEYKVGKTAGAIRYQFTKQKTVAIGEDLWIEASLFAREYDFFKFHSDWNSMIKVLKKLTPELEALKDKTGDHEKKEQIGMLLCSIETHYTLYDIDKVWERVVEAIDFLNLQK